MKTGKRYATLKDVARLAGSSIASVSAVLSGSENRYVSAELRSRILDAAHELNYVKSAMASGLKGISQKVIALLVPQFENSFFTRLSVSVERVAFQHDFNLFICNTMDSPGQERRLVENVISHRVDGILLSPAANGKDSAALIEQFGIPYVVVDRPLESREGYDYVTQDDYQAGVICAREFLGNNHRRLAYIGWKTQALNLMQRQQGFADTIASAAEYYDTRAAESYDQDAGYRNTKDLFQGGNGITAVLYGHNALALGGLLYFREAGIRIPEDVSVILIGSPQWARVTIPPFTCVYQPVEEMGALAAQMLFEKIDGRKTICETRMLQNVLERGGTVRRL